MTQHNYPLDDFPTDAPPGSAEKLEVMISRRERGRHIFHPLDNQKAVPVNSSVRLLIGGVRETHNRGSVRYRNRRKRWECHEFKGRTYR